MTAGEESGAAADAAAWSDRERAQAAAYDAIGDRYDLAFPHKDGQVDCAARMLARLPAGARVLDIGCGTGLPTLRQLVDAGCAVTGIDISPGMLTLAAGNVPRARLMLAGALDLDPSNERYDGVVAFFTLLNLPRARLAQALALINRVLTPGGQLALAMVEADVDDVPIPFLGERIQVTGYLRGELRAVLRSAGFVIEAEDARSYAPATTQAQPEIQLFLNCRQAAAPDPAPFLGAGD